MALELRRGALTYADLAGMPDDGHRYELIDGVLLVTPAPILRHQLVLSHLFRLLAEAAPAGVRVLPAPVDIKVGDATVVQPDLVVLDRPDLDAAFVDTPPLLVVEVLSPSTRRIDVSAKRLVYEGFGVPSYWIVDPEAASITVLALTADGTYAQAGEAHADDLLEVTRPFPVTVAPSSLLT
jgi:Uma2 family endonuclease